MPYATFSSRRLVALTVAPPFPATPLPKSRSRALAFPALTVTTSAPPSSRTERTSSSTWRRTG